MALLKPRPLPTVDVADIVVPPLAEHPEHARLAGLRRALLAGRDDRLRQIDLMALEAELARPTSGNARGPRADAMRERAARLRLAITPHPDPVPTSAGDLPPAVVAALEMLAGGKIAPPQDRAARVAQLRGELLLIDPALSTIEAALDALRAGLSVDVATSLLPQHRTALLEIHRAAVALSEAAEQERRIVAALIAGGYAPAEWILRRPGLPSASRLGTLSQHDSEIADFQRRLAAQGLPI